MKYGKVKGYAPEDSSKWKCNWLECANGLGLAGAGRCSADGYWGYKNCPKFEDSRDDKIKQLQAELEKYKPMPLFLHGLGKLGFTVIINNEVPENQIWFATQKQLDEALAYSMEQARKGE